MKKTEILFGFGAGLLVATSILGALSQLGGPTEAESQTLTREQIEKLAEQSQLVVLSKEEFDQLKQEKKLSLPIAEPPKQPAVPSSPPPEVPKTATPKAPSTGDSVVKASSPPSKPSQPELSQANEPAAPQSSGPASSVMETPAAPVSIQQETAKETKSITIPYKATAEGVARTLVESGILNADNRFVDTLRAQDKLDRIRVGTYQIPLGASEEEIVKIIATPPKK
ncbi:DNA polymerase III subunit gamma/tau [Brevibacillus ruminantium]|uniref:DNA polymerase III subunit gamma/tau n=1 Tax=Brevibacillus ruminantium TaxID=2950604 RepID=A0ABY4WLC9_9BACL|nr:DNA polymerase III subunit gamma/tau [Brevibacillus ruminantium]USG67955.1 DNA polymerase III subunit gamma/tau [Brevibacillus ruminantium]